jgi:hypothetical protein
MTQTSLARPRTDTVETTSLRRILTYAGTIVAFLIGSGFATGQEDTSLPTDTGVASAPEH